MLTLTRLNTEERHMTMDEFLHEIQTQTLNKHRSYLGKYLQPEKLFPWLQSKNILSVDDCEYIRSKETTTMKVSALIDILIKTGPDGLDHLIKAIKKESKPQKFIAVKLERQYNRLKNEAENQRKLQLIQKQNERTRTPPPPYPGNELPHSSRSSCQAQPKYSPIEPSGKQFDIHPPPREPVVSEWPPHTCLDHSEDSDLSLATQVFEHDNFHSEDMRSSSGPSVIAPQSFPGYISDQEEKLSMYVNTSSHTSENHLSIDVRKVRAFSDPVSSRGYTSSNDTCFKDNLMTSVVYDQDVEFSKCQAHLQQLAERRRRPPMARSRSPDEHDASTSLQSLTTEVKGLYLPPDAHSVSPFSSDAAPARLNLPGHSSAPSFTPISPTSDDSSIAIYRPPNNESFEISGGSLYFPPTSY